MDSPNRRTVGSVIAAPILVKWTGASGDVYAFELDPIGTRYQSRSGVYVLCHFGERCQLVPDYVGEADDFSRRLGDLSAHRDWERIRASGATHICTLHVPGKAAQRVKVETDLRRAIMPRRSEMAA
jgi:hypothetical protein